MVGVDANTLYIKAASLHFNPIVHLMRLKCSWFYHSNFRFGVFECRVNKQSKRVAFLISCHLEIYFFFVIKTKPRGEVTTQLTDQEESGQKDVFNILLHSIFLELPFINSLSDLSLTSDFYVFTISSRFHNKSSEKPIQHKGKHW